MDPIKSFTIQPDKIAGGGYATGTVVLESSTHEDGILVYLASENPNVTVPAEVSVPPGSNQVSFKVETIPVQEEQVAQLSASLKHGKPAYAELTIYSQETVPIVSFVDTANSTVYVGPDWTNGAQSDGEYTFGYTLTPITAGGPNPYESDKSSAYTTFDEELGPDDDNKIQVSWLFSALKAGTTYNVTMNGTCSGSNNKFVQDPTKPCTVTVP